VITLFGRIGNRQGKIFAQPTDPDKGEGWMKGQMLAQPVTIVHAHRIAKAD